MQKHVRKREGEFGLGLRLRVQPFRGFRLLQKAVERKPPANNKAVGKVGNLSSNQPLSFKKKGFEIPKETK